MGSLVCAPWAATTDVPSRLLEKLPAGQVDALNQGLIDASDILFAATGRRWRGACGERTVALDLAGRALGGLGWDSLLDLPDYPVTEVTALVDDTGVEVDPATWRLVNGKRLQHIRAYQGRTLPDAWPAWREVTVTYRHGQAPPDGGKAAAAELGGQIALARVGSGECRLPQRVQTVTRQAVTMTVLDKLDFLEKGLTGLTSVDLWIRAVNPSGATRRPTVWSPETRPAGVRY